MQEPDYRTADEYYADKARQEKWERTHGEWAPGLPPMINGRKVRAEFVNPPIPDRSFDWVAVYVDYEPGDPQGYGPTAKAAIEALRDQIED